MLLDVCIVGQVADNLVLDQSVWFLHIGILNQFVNAFVGSVCHFHRGREASWSVLVKNWDCSFSPTYLVHRPSPYQNPLILIIFFLHYGWRLGSPLKSSCSDGKLYTRSLAYWCWVYRSSSFSCPKLYIYGFLTQKHWLLLDFVISSQQNSMGLAPPVWST